MNVTNGDEGFIPYVNKQSPHLSMQGSPSNHLKHHQKISPHTSPRIVSPTHKGVPAKQEHRHHKHQHHSNDKIRRSEIHIENVLDPDEKFVTKAEEMFIMMRPLIVLVLVQLLYSMVLSIFIYRGLSVSKMNTLVEGAQLIIEDFKAQQLTPGFLNISNSDFGKYPSTGCPPNWNLTKLGSFPGTSKGCICPTLQTSTQICQDPCQVVPNHASYPIKEILGTSICTQASSLEQHSLNSVEVVEPTHKEKKNIVTIGDNHFKFDRRDLDITQMEFYSFALAASPPCVNPSKAPHLGSHLVYPFTNKPQTGCDMFGDKNGLVEVLGTTTQGDLLLANNVSQTTTNLPFFDVYYRSDEVIKLFIIRKCAWYQSNDIRQYVFNYPFNIMQNSCLLIQVAMELQCFFSFILFAAGVGLTVYGLSMLQFVKRRKWVPRTYKDLAKRHLSETCLQSVIITGGLEFGAVLITKALYELGMKNQFVRLTKTYVQGLENSYQVLDTFLRIPCFQDVPMNKALLYLRKVTTTCSSNVDKYFEILLAGQILLFVVFIGFLVYHQKCHKKTKKQ